MPSAQTAMVRGQCVAKIILSAVRSSISEVYPNFSRSFGGCGQDDFGKSLVRSNAHIRIDLRDLRLRNFLYQDIAVPNRDDRRKCEQHARDDADLLGLFIF